MYYLWVDMNLVSATDIVGFESDTFIYLIRSQEILSTIDDEVQNDGHEDYNMFILILMSHGARNGHIYGIDGSVIRLEDVYCLLSPQMFPAMSGKPKMIIVQACQGGENKNFSSCIPVHAIKPSWSLN